MALTVAGGSSLGHGSNTELDSILGHTPLKENEGGWGLPGGYGYTGIGQNSSGAPYSGRSREEWELSDTHLGPSTYQPQRRDYTEISNTMDKQDRSDSSHVIHQSVDISGAKPYLQSDPYQTPTQEIFSSPQPQWQPPAFPLLSSANQQPADRSPSPPPQQVDIRAPSTGLRGFSVTLTDPGPSPSVSVNSAHGSMKNVEVHSGRGIGRSFRASIEGESNHF
jgi:hypothetical protein